MSRLFILVLALASVSAGQIENRVVGGQDALSGEFPYQVSFQLVLPTGVTHICGGSILTEKWVVTAGHCIRDMPTNLLVNFWIVAGIRDLVLDLVLALVLGQIRRVSNAIIHPDYQGGINPNDIALLELASPLQFNDKVKPVALPTAGALPTGTATLSGWGGTGDYIGYILPHIILQKVDLPIITYEDCKAALTAINASPNFTDTNVCTGPLTGGKGACSGDSGGPLAYRYNGGAILVGIVSWGFFPCGDVGAPSVYTRVSAFIDFIRTYVPGI